MKREHCAIIACLVLLLSASSTMFSSTFTDGHYYGTYKLSMGVMEYDLNGQYLGYSVVQTDGYELNGITSGPDGLMYGVVEVWPGSTETKVVAFDYEGTVHRTYSCTDFSVTGNTTYGKIDFSSDGYFYIGGFSGLACFHVSDTSSFSLIPNTEHIQDVQVLPNNNLLVACREKIQEIDINGNVIRTIGTFINDISCLEYDPANNVIYASESQGILYQIDNETHDISDQGYYRYASDFYITSENQLLTGSGSRDPGILSMDLEFIDSFGGPSRPFVTQYVPEPATLALLALGGLALRKRK